MSELKVQGKLTVIMDEQNGQTKAGKSWTKQEFVIETQEEYSKKIAFTLFGDKVKILQNYRVGQLIDVSFNIESREYTGKYFHNINAWKINAVDNNQQDEPQLHTAEELPPLCEQLPDPNPDLLF